MSMQVQVHIFSPPPYDRFFLLFSMHLWFVQIWITHARVRESTCDECRPRMHRLIELMVIFRLMRRMRRTIDCSLFFSHSIRLGHRNYSASLLRCYLRRASHLSSSITKILMNGFIGSSTVRFFPFSKLYCFLLWASSCTRQNCYLETINSTLFFFRRISNVRTRATHLYSSSADSKLLPTFIHIKYIIIGGIVFNRIGFHYSSHMFSAVQTKHIIHRWE